MGDAALALASGWHSSDIMGIGTKGPPSAGAADLQGWDTEQVRSLLKWWWWLERNFGTCLQSKIASSNVYFLGHSRHCK